MGRKLYVGNLPYEIGETELQELFARAGAVESVNVMRDQATGRARGFAFIEMSTDEEAQTAIRERRSLHSTKPPAPSIPSTSSGVIVGATIERPTHARCEDFCASHLCGGGCCNCKSTERAA